MSVYAKQIIDRAGFTAESVQSVLVEDIIQHHCSILSSSVSRKIWFKLTARDSL